MAAAMQDANYDRAVAISTESDIYGHNRRRMI
jgi:hypothetical protein